MLPALPVDKITASAREATTAGAAKEEGGSSGGRSRRSRGSAKQPGRRAKQGAQGAQGSQGVQGAQGDQGEQGGEKRGEKGEQITEAVIEVLPVEASAEASTTAGAEVPVLPPVREGEDDWTLEELADVRTRLADEVAELTADIALAESQIAQGDSADGAGDDQADLGTKTYTREHEMSLALNARELLVQNERAIRRIDAGTYGMCESCGNAIGKARLQAFPRATLCVRCKQREERR